MPDWGWLCLWLFVGLVVVVGALGLLFYVKVVLPYDRQEKHLKEHGQDVVAWVLLANPSVYQSMSPPTFEFASVVFTLDNDPSDEHLAFLEGVAGRLQGFKASRANSDEQRLEEAMETQRTVGDVLRVPDRVTGGRAVYFSTPGVTRSMLPEDKLTRPYIQLRVVVNGPLRGSSMIPYPDAPPPTPRRR
jgi:hypothetical protein